MRVGEDSSFATIRAGGRRREREQAADMVTVRNVIAEWGWHYARRERKRPREAVRLLKVYVAWPWKGRAVRDLTRRDAVLLLDRITARGSRVMANRIRNLANQAFAFAVERDLIEVNPFAGTRKPGGRERPKERSLTAEEIGWVWRGLESRDFKASRGVRVAMKLVLVSAQRPGEVAGMRWDEIDLEGQVWTIRAARSKNGREHHVPLTDLALELLGEARALAPGRPHVFPSAHAHRKADAPMLALALSRALRNNRRGERVLGVEWFTPHDLRRSAASMMTSLGIPRLHVAKLLNHADRDVTSIYDRHDYAAEKRSALQAWADHLRGLVAGKKPQVVPIRPEAGVAS